MECRWNKVKWSGNVWTFFPQYIRDRFVVSKWAPQYTTEQFVVLFRYNRHCEPVPNAYWPKRQKILCPYENVQFFVHLHKIQTYYDLQNWNFPFYPLGHCCPLLIVSPPLVHICSNQRHSPHYIAGVLEHLECWTNTVCVLIRKNGIYVITQTNLCQ